MVNPVLPDVYERHGDFRCWRRPTSEAESLLATLLPDPDTVLDAGERLTTPWRSAATSKRRIILGNAVYFLKRYNCEGWGYRLKNALRPSRAVRAWKAVAAFNRCSVPTPNPLLCLEERHGLLLGRAYLLFPFVGELSGSLLDLWPSLTDAERLAGLNSLGATIGDMHRQGLLHGDLNWRNVLVAKEGDGLRFWLVDLDGSKLVAAPKYELAMEDLRHFLRDMDRAQVDAALHEIFVDRWRSAYAADRVA